MSSPTALAGNSPTTPFAVSHSSSISRSIIFWASSYSLRAVSPESASSRISGNDPFISQALKNGCQSM
jgi:hypothetical protein